MKTVTLADGSTATMDFFCERYQCYMLYTACAKMYAKANRLIKTQYTPRFVNTRFLPAEHIRCIKCPEGARNYKNIHSRKRAHKRGEQPANCAWPGCEKPAKAIGLCAMHLQRARRNTLIRINTKDADPVNLAAFLNRLIKIATKHKLPVEDVAIACLDEGINAYTRRTLKS